MHMTIVVSSMHILAVVAQCVPYVLSMTSQAPARRVSSAARSSSARLSSVPAFRHACYSFSAQGLGAEVHLMPGGSAMHLFLPQSKFAA